MAWDVTVKENATIEDTLRLIVQAVNQCSQEPYAREVANALHTSDTLTFLKKLFAFVKQNVQYVNDTDGIERVYTPDRTIREGKGDCKKMTVLIASVLKAAGIEPILKHVVYGPAEKWTHIYTIVSTVPGWPVSRSQYYVLDPTIPNGKFNDEVSYKSGMMMNLNGQTSKPMDLHMMGKGYMNSEGGMPFSKDIANCHDSMKMAGDSLLSGPTLVGRKHILQNLAHKIHPEVLNHIKKGVTPHQAVTAALFPGGRPAIADKTANIPYEQQRGAFLQLIRNNVDGIATHLLAALGQDPKALDNIWHIVGGDATALKKEVLAAAKKPPTPSDSEKTAGGTLIGKGFFKKLLHGAATILHAVAPVVNAIIPGAGVALNNIAAKAENVAADIPTKDAKGNLLPPPPHADIPIDKNGIPFGHAEGKGAGAHHGAVFGVEPGKPLLTATKVWLWGSFQIMGMKHVYTFTHTMDIVAGLCLTSAVLVSAILSTKLLKHGRI